MATDPNSHYSGPAGDAEETWCGLPTVYSDIRVDWAAVSCPTCRVLGIQALGDGMPAFTGDFT